VRESTSWEREVEGEGTWVVFHFERDGTVGESLRKQSEQSAPYVRNRPDREAVKSLRELGRERRGERKEGRRRREGRASSRWFPQCPRHRWGGGEDDGSDGPAKDFFRSGLRERLDC